MRHALVLALFCLLSYTNGFGLLELSMCPYGGLPLSGAGVSKFGQYTTVMALPSASSVGQIWVGYDRPGNTKCPETNLGNSSVQMSSQTFTIPNLVMAQNNSGSGQYVISVLRAASVPAACNNPVTKH